MWLRFSKSSAGIVVHFAVELIALRKAPKLRPDGGTGKLSRVVTLPVEEFI
jgi:hypothetical protein